MYPAKETIARTDPFPGDHPFREALRTLRARKVTSARIAAHANTSTSAVKKWYSQSTNTRCPRVRAAVLALAAQPEKEAV